MTSHNGPAPDSSEAQLLALLGHTVDELQARHDHLKAELADVSARLGRYRRMQGTGKKPSPKPSTQRSRRSGDGASTGVSLERQELVLTAIRTAGEPVSVAQLVAILGVSRYSVDTTIAVLRQQERVRFAGKGGTTGNASLWAPFPETSEVD